MRGVLHGRARPAEAGARPECRLLLGYFEGLDSERAIAGRAADSLRIRTILDFALREAPPDHSTLSRTLRPIDIETQQAVWGVAATGRRRDGGGPHGGNGCHDAGSQCGDAEHGAAAGYGERADAFLTRLASASSLSTPTRAELARFDRTRTKKGSNDDWTHPHDPDVKIAKMKDCRTHMAHTAEQAVDLQTGAIVGVRVQDASAGDTTTVVDALVTAAEQVKAVGAPGIVEVVAFTG